MFRTLDTFCYFLLNSTATTEIYTYCPTLSLHDALPISWHDAIADRPDWILSVSEKGWTSIKHGFEWLEHFNRHTEGRTTGAYRLLVMDGDRKSTRLNSSH